MAVLGYDLCSLIVFAVDERGCWLWVGPQVNGYGRHKHQPAHRLVYQLMVGEIPDGLVLDHLCSTRSCVYPDHLEPVTFGENVSRSHTNGHQAHFEARDAYVAARLSEYKWAVEQALMEGL